MNSIIGIGLVFVLRFCSVVSQECGCNQIPSIEIINDEQLANGIQQVRDEFLIRQVSNKFDRLSATILIREKNSPRWKRGSVEELELNILLRQSN